MSLAQCRDECESSLTRRVRWRDLEIPRARTFHVKIYSFDNSSTNMTIICQMFEHQVQYSTLKYNTTEWLRAEMTIKYCGKPDGCFVPGLPSTARFFQSSAHTKLRYRTDETSAKFSEYCPKTVCKKTGNCQYAAGCNRSSRVGDTMVVEVTAIIKTMTWGWSFRFSEMFSTSSGILWQVNSYRHYKGTQCLHL